MFRVRQHEVRTLSWWYDDYESIDTNPPYQRRGGVWTKVDQSFLIDSILNDYDLPKIYLADFTVGDNSLNKRKMRYAVIDGRQRLEALFGFFKGKVYLPKNFYFVDDPSLELGGLTYSDLQATYPRVARKFENFNLPVMSVITDDVARINELFVRLNRGRALTGAEIRNAMAGVVPEIIRKLSNHQFFAKCAKFSVKRGQDKNLAAKLLLLEFNGSFTETKKKKLDQFVQLFTDEAMLAEDDKLDRAAKRVRKVLSTMSRSFQSSDPLLSTQGPVTVYYWLFRRCSKSKTKYIRSFLVHFDSLVRKARKQLQLVVTDAPSSEGPRSMDADIYKYIELSRSTNDKGSLLGRYTILKRRLDGYLSAKSTKTVTQESGDE